MKNLMTYSAYMIDKFDNDVKNIDEFQSLLNDAAHGVYVKYSHDEANEMFRTQFDRILGINYKQATPQQRRQAMRLHGPELYSLVENTITDKMQSGIQDPFFMQWVDQKNIAEGDMNEFWVTDANSLLIVSRYAGDHTDVVMQQLYPGKAFRVDTDWSYVAVYASVREMMLGRIDWTELVARAERSIAEDVKARVYDEFANMDKLLPTDMKIETPATEATREDIIAAVDAVRAATGSDVTLVGSKVAIAKLQNTVPYALYSNDMKNERHNNQILANWEGYDVMPLDRINKLNTRESLLDNTKILILPNDPEFKPIKYVVEGITEYVTRTPDQGAIQDNTQDQIISYMDGVGTVVNQLFGEIILKQ